MTWSDIVSQLSITTPRSRALSTTLTVYKSTETLLLSILSIWFLCPSHITCVLDELRRSRLELVHAPTSATHPARRSKVKTRYLQERVGHLQPKFQGGRGRPPANILIPLERQLIALKHCGRLFVLYCRNCPKDDKFRYFVPILRKLGAA